MKATPYHRRRANPQWSRNGSALFEFAVTLPLMILLAFAIRDFAKITFLHFLVSDAAGAASRYASSVPINPNSLSSWQQNLEASARQTLAGSPWIQPSDLIVPPVTLEQIGPDERRITVRVEYSFSSTLHWLNISKQNLIFSEVTVYGAN